MVKVQVLNLAFAVVDVNPENFRKSPVFSKSAAAVAADPHGLNSETDGFVFGSHEHDAVESEVKLKPSAGMRRLVRKEPRRARIVNLEVSSGLLSESVAVIEANVYRPGWYPVRMRRNSDPDCFSIVKS